MQNFESHRQVIIMIFTISNFTGKQHEKRPLRRVSKKQNTF